MRDVRALKIDMTRLGWGLFEYTQEKFKEKMQGVNFGSSVAATQRMQAEGNPNLTVRVTEALATQLLHVFEDRAIHIPIDDLLRDDLRKPERMVTPSGRVSIAATRNEAGHADHFWSLALAIDAAKTENNGAADLSESDPTIQATAFQHAEEWTDHLNAECKL